MSVRTIFLQTHLEGQMGLQKLYLCSDSSCFTVRTQCVPTYHQVHLSSLASSSTSRQLPAADRQAGWDWPHSMTPGYQLDGSEPETEKVDYRAKQDKACVLLCVCVCRVFTLVEECSQYAMLVSMVIHSNGEELYLCSDSSCFTVSIFHCQDIRFVLFYSFLFLC